MICVEQEDNMYLLNFNHQVREKRNHRHQRQKQTVLNSYACSLLDSSQYEIMKEFIDASKHYAAKTNCP